MLFQPRARVSDPETSHEAAESMLHESQVQRSAIREVLSTHGGMTADEIDDMLESRGGWRMTTAGRRLSELQVLGLVERTDERRQTRSGRSAFVWRLPSSTSTH